MYRSLQVYCFQVVTFVSMGYFIWYVRVRIKGQEMLVFQKILQNEVANI